MHCMVLLSLLKPIKVTINTFKNMYLRKTKQVKKNANMGSISAFFSMMGKGCRNAY